MGKIILLNEEIASAISAGEVVERPLSVVKELVENSIDANSTRIEIGIEEGGKKTIWVKDNGIGMDRDDLEKCLHKHATSKISRVEDLYNITSLGFRGEALYSISAVSELTILTKTKEELQGYELKSSYGSSPIIREVGTSNGTYIIVKNLFANIPARKKFLKSALWEKSLILEYIEGIAILYPEIEIIFSDNNKILLLLNSTDSIETRIFQIFPSLYGKLNSYKIQNNEYSAKVYISYPDLPLSNFHIFSVNRRFVKDRLFYKVLNDYYGEQRKRSPFVAIFLEIPPNEVDVNVHPTKKEVKFHRYNDIYNLLRELLEKASKKEIFYVPEVNKEELPKINKDISEYKIEEKKEDFLPYLYSKEINKYDECKIIGTFCNGYVLVEKEKTLYIIDQHAAHERLIFNKIIESYKEGGKNSQKIIPYIINISESKMHIYETHRNFLEKFGYSFEQSGPMSLAITAIPSFLSFETAIDLIISIIDDINIFKREEDFIKKMSSISACKEAIKKTTKLNIEEIEYLLQSLTDKDIETFCPHGRNFIISITLDELEKKFGRKN
ncbi:MAG: DNA mismatch repair endonuclease MutL [Proteobacteria bacterium]|nr:DNA mismatch repair endonuclease MutL [Pseudomonadota bacterium]